MRYWLLFLLAMLLIGCGDRDRRGPPPTVTVEIFSSYEFTLDGETVTKPVLKERLRELADKHRRPIVNNSRVYMQLIAVGPGTGTELQEIMSYCHRIGLDKIRIGR